MLQQNRSERSRVLAAESQKSVPRVMTVDELPKFVVIDDVQAIRAMAHQARQRALDELYGTHRAYTATELAARCEISPSAMSYHLRALEKYGYIRRVEQLGDGRNKYWQAVAFTLRIVGFDAGSQSENPSVTSHIEGMRQRVGKEVRRRRARAADLHDEALYPVITSSRLDLRDDQAEEFMERLHALLDEYALTSGKLSAEEATRRIHYFVSAIEEPREATES